MRVRFYVNENALTCYCNRKRNHDEGYSDEKRHTRGEHFIDDIDEGFLFAVLYLVDCDRDRQVRDRVV